MPPAPPPAPGPPIRTVRYRRTSRQIRSRSRNYQSPSPMQDVVTTPSHPNDPPEPPRGRSRVRQQPSSGGDPNVTATSSANE
eukprot:4904162-Amphidinium_carterae.1